jgi:predicted polyphosphate/ATP-dependent NAD kinase
MYKWAFIYKTDDGSAATRVDVIGTLVCVGVPGVEDAAAEARKLVSQGVKLIELCGGFGAAGLALVTSAVGTDVPVGAVFFGADAAPGLQRLMG